MTMFSLVLISLAFLSSVLSKTDIRHKDVKVKSEIISPSSSASFNLDTPHITIYMPALLCVSSVTTTLYSDSIINTRSKSTRPTRTVSKFEPSVTSSNLASPHATTIILTKIIRITVPTTRTNLFTSKLTSNINNTTISVTISNSINNSPSSSFTATLMFTTLNPTSNLSSSSPTVAATKATSLTVYTKRILIVIIVIIIKCLIVTLLIRHRRERELRAFDEFELQDIAL